LSKIKLLLCDIDGTLTGANGRGHSARLLPLLLQLKARGAIIGLVTGRETLSARVVHRLFDLNGPIVGENGAEIILDPAANEWDARRGGGLASSRIATLAKKIADCGLLEHLRMDVEKKHMLTLFHKTFPRHRPEELPVWSRRVASALQEDLADLEITYSSAAIDISARGTNKGRGIELVCEALQIAPHTVAFVGDSNNDQAAFDFVRRSGGELAFVGTDPAVKKSLHDYPRVYFAQRYASEGAADFFQYLLEHNDY